MSILIWLLTVVLVLDCLFLLLLILVQLPKKEAGMGQAFGGATTDALFGAGSGNALTKMTKYAAGIFLVLTLGLSVLHANHKNSKSSSLEQEMSKLPKPSATAPVVPGNAATPALESSNAPAVVDTNAPAKPVAPVTAPASNAPAAK